MKDILLAIDQGTTGTTVLAVDRKLKILGKVNQEFRQHYPKPGWVEHDPEEIWQSVLSALKKLLQTTKLDPKRIAGIGITNQRETTLLWDRVTGNPLYRAIVWQDRRTADLCEKLKKRGLEKTIRDKTGLVLDPYFSGTKLQWLLQHVPEAKVKVKKGTAAFGTIDTFLVWKLTAGKTHVTDVSNASRTLLFNLKSLHWDANLLKLFQVPASVLPEVRSSSEIYGHTFNVPGLPNGIPIAGIAGDQQAALFGQACFDPGTAKCTYGTGSFILFNTGNKIIISKNRLLTTVAWKIGKQVTYALEGSAFIAGAAVQWLRDGLQFFKSAEEVETLAKSVSDSNGVYFVPALVGLGAPYWNAEARGVISGLTRDTQRAHIARATLEGIAYLQHDILEAMTKDLKKKLKTLKVDGGATTNNLLMQFQADLLGVPLVRPQMVETTALGAAFLAGLATGVWKNTDEIAKAWKEDKTFKPQMPAALVKQKLNGWKKAVGKV